MSQLSIFAALVLPLPVFTGTANPYYVKLVNNLSDFCLYSQYRNYCQELTSLLKRTQSEHSQLSEK